MNLLVSACLLGVNCRYCGDACCSADVLKLKDRFGLIPVCPEQLGGFPTPRPPVELQSGKAVTCTGKDCTEIYQRGAGEALKIAWLFHCRCAILKSKSPSCGCGKIYDGTFSGTLVPGNGITAGLLRKNGIRILNEMNCTAEL